MRTSALHPILLPLVLGCAARSQQVPDLDFHPAIPQPAYAAGQGPRVAIDGAHRNFHTVAGRYQPFADFLRRDGYRVEGLERLISPESLKDLDLLVIANPLHERNLEAWSLPTPSAYSAEEIAALHAWVQKGGALFLIVDHMPFPGCTGDLARAFGVEFANGFATQKAAGQPAPFTFRAGAGLMDSPVTRGRREAERITQVTTFTGSALRPPRQAVPVLAFDASYESLEPQEAWVFSETTRRRPLQGWCQGALLASGKGRLAVFGEAAMFSAQLAGPTKRKVGMNAPEADQNPRFLLNVLHWLTRAKGMPD